MKKETSFSNVTKSLSRGLFSRIKNGKILSIIVTLSLMLTMGVSSAFANDKVTVSDRVKESFKKEFGSAEFVNWSELGDYLRASFVLGGHRAEAYFNTDGELQGCIRDLFYDQLPLAVMTSIDKRFAAADILEVREITNSEGTSYLVSLEQQEKQLRVKVSTSGYILDVEKLKKK